MSEKEIIERLIWDMECIFSKLEEDIRNDIWFQDDLKLYYQLVNSGKYRKFPSYYEQTPESIEELKILSNKNLNDE